LEVIDPLPQIPEGHRVLLTLGRLHPKKAQDVLIKALPSIPDATLLIAGTGELQEDLEKLAADLGVKGRTFFLGLRKDIRQLFNLADVCVFPSRFEPLGNVILEAWATGTPVVAAASQGPSWLISHRENGLLFEVDNVKQCARQVNDLLSDREMAETLSRNGYNKLKDQFSLTAIIGQYKQLFERLIATK